MPVPRLILGRQDAAHTLHADQGYGDDGVVYNMAGQTARTAPAGTGGEVVFTNLYVTVTRAGAATIRFTPLVDETVQAPTEVVLPDVAVPGTEEATVLEISLLQPYLGPGAVEALRYYPRGRWIQVLAETLFASPAAMVKVVLNDFEVEYEVVRETQPAVT